MSARATEPGAGRGPAGPRRRGRAAGPALPARDPDRATATALVEATTGEQALLEAATRTPDVVLLDLGLPDLDGVEVTRRLREWSAVPIIVLSARGQEGDKIGPSTPAPTTT